MESDSKKQGENSRFICVDNLLWLCYTIYKGYVSELGSIWTRLGRECVSKAKKRIIIVFKRFVLDLAPHFKAQAKISKVGELSRKDHKVNRLCGLFLLISETSGYVKV